MDEERRKIDKEFNNLGYVLEKENDEMIVYQKMEKIKTEMPGKMILDELYPLKIIIYIETESFKKIDYDFDHREITTEEAKILAELCQYIQIS